MGVRFVGGAAIILTAAAAVACYLWATAGNREAEAATERIAAAVARGDRDALEREPLLKGHEATVAWLLQYRTALAGGYRVGIRRNGNDGYHLSAEVTHLGEITTPAGRTLRLGFRYDRGTDRLEFVTASFS
jgi:hypothetical protein